MLKHLYIKNYALIESLDIDFHTGFTAITGETGAGKSIILGALGLLLGERADSKSIKAGAKKCIVEAVFDISSLELDAFFSEHDIDADTDECIVRREVSDTGKSRCFVNDMPVPVTVIKSLGNSLVDIHSQHQNLLLNNKAYQLQIVDTIGQHMDQVILYKKAYASFLEADRQCSLLEQNLVALCEEQESRQFCLKEIEQARMYEGEQAELEEEATILDNAGVIKEALYQAECLLTGENSGIISSLNDCQRRLNAVNDVFSAIRPLTERIDSCSIELDDIRNEISSLLYRIQFDPERQNFVNERLDLINSLESKYHQTDIKGLLKLAEDMRSRLEETSDSEEELEKWRQKREEAHHQAWDIARQLSASRCKAIPQVEASVSERLMALGMPHVRICIDHKETETLSPTGIDNITVLFSANKEMPLREIASIASGGEMARVMLSLKAILATSCTLSTLIFDEIDTGVSGRTAEQMALTMKDISRHGTQVISITHLPQIAAQGDYHYLVYKEETADSTVSHIKKLTKTERIQEIAHMLSGVTITEAALLNAQALLDHNLKP